MTIHQLKAPCWTLVPPPDDERDPHYGTWHEADEALRELREELGPDPLDLTALESVRAKRLDTPCWVAECDAPDGPEGTCGETLGDDDEGPSCIHFETAEELSGWMPAECWTHFGPDGALCCAHSPHEAAGPLPSAPAELEAAGQLRLPGVTP